MFTGLAMFVPYLGFGVGLLLLGLAFALPRLVADERADQLLGQADSLVGHAAQLGQVDLADVHVEPQMLDDLGPAINAGKGLFL